MRRILFVCTGNTCRSPMAESMMRHLMKERGIEAEVRSAGVSAWNGTPMSEHAQQVLQHRKMDNPDFSSQLLSDSLVEWADLVLTLTSGHKRHVLQLFPDVSEKTFTLNEYANQSQQDSSLEEWTSFTAELQMKIAQGIQPTEADITRYYTLQQKLPNMDIADPYGGSLEDYQMTAQEIEAAINKILDQFLEN